MFYTKNKEIFYKVLAEIDDKTIIKVFIISGKLKTNIISGVGSYYIFITSYRIIFLLFIDTILLSKEKKSMK